MLIGFLFAYIYIKTGKVIYTIFLHMVMNCVTSAVTLGIYQWVIKAGNRIGIDMMDSNVQYDEQLLTQEVLKGDLGAISFMASCTVLMIWFGILFLTAVAGLVLFIVFAATKRIKITKKEGHETVGKQIKGLFSPAMWLFYVLCAILFGLTYLPPIIEFMVNAIKNR